LYAHMNNKIKNNKNKKIKKPNLIRG
jgi:hypothetical protein